MSAKHSEHTQHVRFGNLWAGDRFICAGVLWTCLGGNIARKHSLASRNLAELGFGYVGDALCSFMPEDSVQFVPVAPAP